MFPCYNDAETIGGLVDDVHAALEPLTVRARGDRRQRRIGATGHARCSTRCAADRPWLRVIHHERNRGYGGALISGFTAAEQRVDLLHRRRRAVRRQGGRDARPARHRGRRRRAGLEDRHAATRCCAGSIGRVYHHVVKMLFRLPVRDTDCDFRMFRRRLIVERPLTSSSGVICVEMMRTFDEAGARFVETPVHHYSTPVRTVAVLPGAGRSRGAPGSCSGCGGTWSSGGDRGPRRAEAAGCGGEPGGGASTARVRSRRRCSVRRSDRVDDPGDVRGRPSAVVHPRRLRVPHHPQPRPDPAGHRRMAVRWRRTATG